MVKVDVYPHGHMFSNWCVDRVPLDDLLIDHRQDITEQQLKDIEHLLRIRDEYLERIRCILMPLYHNKNVKDFSTNKKFIRLLKEAMDLDRDLYS